MRNFKHSIQLLLALLAFISSPAYSESNSASQQIRTDIIPMDEILALNANIRGMLDTLVKPLASKEQRARAIHDLMFDEDKFALKYDGGHTKTAIETIESGSGNCVSLSIVFVAMARYADLKAYFLDVDVPKTWQRESDVYFQFKHVSSVAKVWMNDYLGIEYRSMGRLSAANLRKIDDQAAFAAFYSNLGIELLMQEKMDAAIEYLKYSTELDPDSANWSNLGIAYRYANRLDEAEEAYLRALKENKADLTALNNLAILYEMTGQKKLSDKYTEKLERYHLQNPYYLIKLAKTEMNVGNYAKALKHAEKAINKYRDEPEFHFVVAQIYAHQGDTQRAAKYLRNAEKFASYSSERDLYSRKLELLGQIQPGKSPL
jgi:Flp pilus assembly protein TadD